MLLNAYNPYLSNKGITSILGGVSVEELEKVKESLLIKNQVFFEDDFKNLI